MTDREQRQIKVIKARINISGNYTDRLKKEENEKKSLQIATSLGCLCNDTIHVPVHQVLSLPSVPYNYLIHNP